MQIYIVYFNTGEYEDRRQLIYKIFSSKEKAEAYCEVCNWEAKEAGINKKGSNLDKRYDDDFQNPFRFCIDYTGVWFTISDAHEVEE
jgi:hypothetical protein